MCKVGLSRKTSKIPVTIHLRELKSSYVSLRSSEQKKQFGVTKAKAFLRVSILKWWYSIFLFSCFRFKIILHLLSFFDLTKTGETYSFFEWAVFFLLSPYLGVQSPLSLLPLFFWNWWLGGVFSCIGSSVKSISTPSAIFSTSLSIVSCWHCGKWNRIWPALKFSDCCFSSAFTLGMVSWNVLTSFDLLLWCLAAGGDTSLSYWLFPLNFPIPLWFQGFPLALWPWKFPRWLYCGDACPKKDLLCP